MSTSLVDADSLLVIDIGSVTTRAFLFDVVDGRYRFLASGQAPSTAGAPFRDVSEGMRLAIDQLQGVTGRTLVGENERLIIPSPGGGSGVDTFSATVSAGPPLRVAVVGLLEDVSLESARRLAASTYSGPLETISLNDRRKPEARIDALLRLRPDLVIVAGGTENGASQSVLKLLESVGLACYLLPEESRPEMLFAGNPGLQGEVQTSIGGFASLNFAPNVRPSLDSERLLPAEAQLAELVAHIRARQINGVLTLHNYAGGNLLPTASAFGRIVRFLSKTHTSSKGVLGVDIGASATTLAAGLDGDLALNVYPQFGLGSSLAKLLENVSLDEITRWLSLEIAEPDLRAYLANKALYPASLPVTPEELAIEQALARCMLQNALKLATPGLPAKLSSPAAGLLPAFEPIIATGSVLTHAPTLGQSLLMLLDGLQPTGATTFVLDQNHITAALGVAAAINPVLSVQVLDSNAFLHLGTVVSPLGNARSGTPVLRVTMTNDETGVETGLEVKQGTLEALPLPAGQTARLQLQPLQRYDVGMGGPGRSGKLRVTGGALGVVIDARGRPLRLPEEPARRYELYKKWLWTLGG